MRPLLLLLLTSDAVASPLPVRADWMRDAGVSAVRFYGPFGDGNLIGGVDGQGRLRVALERQQRTGSGPSPGTRPSPETHGRPGSSRWSDTVR
ncbi:hypothetical protein [Deinococcus planocerae]|uniref:hypothetical protein n=1 Tax=Deinococcus planocerae TaxID=1737569 RepID=UPI000C7F1504|nr:hypothetical protein [Deinococcus planocerae]